MKLSYSNFIKILSTFQGTVILFSLKELEQASHLVHSVFSATPQYNWPQLSHDCGCEIWVKHENHTPTTAFKVRGGIVLIDALMKSAEPPKGLISATIGNHGQSLAFAGKRAGLPVTIVVPEGNNEDQNRAIQSHGANLVIFGHDFEAARQHSLTLQHELGYRAVAPFERELVLGGGQVRGRWRESIREGRPHRLPRPRIPLRTRRQCSAA